MEGVGQPGSLALPEVVNCFPHSRHLRGPSAMWIFRWAFRFPTCARQGSERPPHTVWPWVPSAAPPPRNN